MYVLCGVTVYSNQNHLFVGPDVTLDAFLKQCVHTHQLHSICRGRISGFYCSRVTVPQVQGARDEETHQGTNYFKLKLNTRKGNSDCVDLVEIIR